MIRERVHLPSQVLLCLILGRCTGCIDVLSLAWWSKGVHEIAVLMCCLCHGAREVCTRSLY